MTIFDEPKIDTHVHVLDPARFAYGADIAYKPAAQEIGTRAQLMSVCKAYGVHHALIVGPNSGYGQDNRCTLDAIARSGGRWKGIAVVPNDVAFDELVRLKAEGIVGVAINATYHSVDCYRDVGALMGRLADLDMFLQIQVEGDQLADLAPQVLVSSVKLLIDHCGRPVPEAGLTQPGFKALLDLGATGRAAVKLSGYSKFAREPHPHRDTWPFVRALVDTFGPENCMWASDWPHLRAPERIDYGVLLKLAELILPDPAERRQIMWETPKRLFGFGEVAG
jgi:predicted TIM-barrel fold metal-dependent hydrolase